MKTKILTFNIILLFIFFSSSAQKFEFGIKGGGNIASQKLNNVTNIESITGFHLGGFIYLKLPILFGIQAEAHYSQQGSQFSINQIINTNCITLEKINILLESNSLESYVELSYLSIALTPDFEKIIIPFTSSSLT